jgi:hypothetical protein
MMEKGTFIVAYALFMAGCGQRAGVIDTHPRDSADHSLSGGAVFSDTDGSGGQSSHGTGGAGGSGSGGGGTLAADNGGSQAATTTSHTDPELLYYATFDSAESIKAPAVGPGGTVSGGSFVPGKKGNGWSSSRDKQATFPASVVPADRGTIEFWALLRGYPANETIPWGNTPYFISACDEHCRAQYAVGLNGNDGWGGAGLVGWAGHGNTATKCYGSSVTYGAAIGDVTAWHHYALSWDKDGVPGTTYRIQLFLDGKPVSTPRICGENHDPDALTLPTGTVTIVNLQNQNAGRSVVVDELKIWNYAKTDFADSLM